MKECKKCHFMNDDDAKFCSKCGETLIHETNVEKVNQVSRRTITSGAIIGFVAAGLIFFQMIVPSYIEAFNLEQFNTELFQEIASILLFVAMLILSIIGLIKSIKKQDLIGKIVNPIALGMSIIFINIPLIGLIDLFTRK